MTDNYPWNTLGLCQGDIPQELSEEATNHEKTVSKSKCPEYGLTIVSNLPTCLRCGYLVIENKII